MSDITDALELTGLAQIGRGETAASLFDGISKIFKVQFNKLRARGNAIKEKYFFPAKNLFHKDSRYEFTDLDSWPFLPPLSRGLKTKFGVYLDNLIKDYPPDSEVFFDDRMNIYIQTKNDPTKFRVYKPTKLDLEDAGWLDWIGHNYEIEIKQKNSQPLSPGILKDATKVIERQLRALQRDAKGTFEGKKRTLKDPNLFKKDENQTKKRAQAYRAGVTVPLIDFYPKNESLEKTLERLRENKEKLNFNAFELLNDAIKYERWIHTGGMSRKITGYEIQDIENQIKVIKALSNSKIRSIAVNVINKALKGKGLTFTDLYRDIQSISGIGPVQINADMLRLKEGDVRDTAQVYDDLVNEITKYAPSTKQIFADQTLDLASKAAIGAVLQYIPKVGGFISGAVGAIGGSVGLLTGVGAETIFVLAMICYNFIRKKRISQNTKERDTKELQNLLTETVKETTKSIEQSNENYKDLMNQVINDRKNNRITSDEAGLARARIEYQKALNQIGSDVINESQIILNEKMASPKKYPYIKYDNKTDPKKVTMFFKSSNTGTVRSITSSIYIDRKRVELIKQDYAKKFPTLARLAMSKYSSPDLRIAFIETRMNDNNIGRDGTIVSNVEIDPDAVNNQEKHSREISAFTADVKNVAVNSLKNIASNWIGNLPLPLHEPLPRALSLPVYVPPPPPPAPPFPASRPLPAPKRKRHNIVPLDDYGNELHDENIVQPLDIWNFDEGEGIFIF